MVNRNTRKHRRKNKQKYALAGYILLFLILFCCLFLWSIGEKIEDKVTNKTYNISSNEKLDDKSHKNDVLESNTQNNNNPTSINMETPWNLMLVNKWNPIPKDYEINLVEVQGGEKVDERIYEHLMEMLEDAREGNWGELPMVVSGYRTQEVQQSIYDDKINEYEKEGYSQNEAIEQAEQWVAVPGYSEHQLGFAVDINGATYDVYFWLQENSYKYGFIFRYPGHKTSITGVAEEVWHYRYVGVEAATEIYEKGICLEEYLDTLT